MYIAIPVLLYVGERIFRAIRSGLYEVEILKVYIVVLFGRKFGTKVHNFGNCSMQSATTYFCFNEKCLITIMLRLFFLFLIHLQASIYPGKVLSLKLQKPEGFKYHGGMYIFIQCPHISPFEW